MQRELKLNGGEISLLKALGLSGTPIAGKLLLERVEMEEAEVVETIEGLLNSGYILASKVNVQKLEDIERSYFRVNPSYMRDLRDAMRPGRRREEERVRRRRS